MEFKDQAFTDHEDRGADLMFGSIDSFGGILKKMEL